MAVSLVNDVISYCTERGSPVYTCSLDAQGAFDAIPHPVLFRKAIDVLPDHCWMIIVNWYRAIYVQIKWGSALSEPISVHKGTRQGGLSSPFLFNLFYQDLINELSECTGGIIINKQSFNVFCYADDLMLASLKPGIHTNDFAPIYGRRAKKLGHASLTTVFRHSRLTFQPILRENLESPLLRYQPITTAIVTDGVSKHQMAPWYIHHLPRESR